MLQKNICAELDENLAMEEMLQKTSQLAKH
jgi:hypothetical protein